MLGTLEGLLAVTDYSLTHSVFRVGPAFTSPFGVAADARHPAGTTFAFTLSDGATVTIDLSRCARRRAGRCSRYAFRGRLTRTGHAGVNRVAFSGRLGSKPQPLGRYRAVLVATDSAGERTAPRTRSFAIVSR